MGTRVTLILSAAIVVAAGILGLSFYAARASGESISVVGSASTRFSADRVKWQLSIGRTVPQAELTDGYADMRLDYQRLKEVLLEAGLTGEEISPQPVTTHPVHAPDGQIRSYRMMQPVQVISGELDTVQELALNPGDYLHDGMVLERSQLEYFYSGIDELKHELLRRATVDAQGRAEQIAEPAGMTIGTVREARAGVFQIREPFSTEVSGYGMYNTTSREKEISVTVHATFRAR